MNTLAQDPSATFTADPEVVRLIRLYRDHRALAAQLETAGHPMQAKRNLEHAREYLRLARDRAFEQAGVLR